MENIKCPICQSPQCRAYQSKNGCELFRCQDCDLVFVYPTPGNLADFYQESYFHNNKGQPDFGYTDYDQDKQPMREVFVRHLERFSNLVAGRRIFDVGAATGFFLDLAKEQGWETAGIEISVYAAQEAARRGHQVTAGLLPALDPSSQYDVITMWDVLEHIDNPQSYLKKAHQLLAAGGLLAVNTIDLGSWWARLMGPRWHLFVPPEHLLYFSGKNLKLLLEESGFEIIAIRKIGKTFSLAYVFKMLYQWQRLKIWKYLTNFFNRPFWRRLAVPINLRDNIFILARKK